MSCTCAIIAPARSNLTSLGPDDTSLYQKHRLLRMGAGEVRAFLEHLAFVSKVRASTQNQNFNALVSIYDKYIGVW